MGSTATIHTTTQAGQLRYPGSRRIDRQSATGHLFYVAATGNQYQVYRSTNNGVSWSTFGGARTAAESATIVEMGQLFVDWQNRLYLTYRTNVGGQDKVWMQAGVITATNVSWHTQLLAASGPNSGVAGSYLSGMSLGIIRHNDGRTTGFVAVGWSNSSSLGVACYGFTIPTVGQPVLNLGVVAGKRSWSFAQTGGGHQVPAVIYEYSPAHMWIAWGRTHLWALKMTWNGSGWNGPTSGVRLSFFGSGFPTPPAIDSVSGAWRAPGFIVCQPYQFDTTQVVVFERNQANTTTTVRISPSHPAGVVKHCVISWNNVSRDFRVWAVGTSDNLLYYVDYIQATGTWSGWSSLSATAVAGIDNYSVRRESFGSARYDVLYQNGAASPWNITHVSQDLVYAPFAPRWQFGQGGNNMEANGRAWDVARDLDLRWLFTDPDTADVQTAWALSRQIGAGTIQYLRASDSTWQATEQKNPGATGLRTLGGFTWGVATDANHTYRVKVWDGSDTASVYSDGLTVVPSTPVNPTITSPAADGQVITTDTLKLEWSVAEQTAFRVKVQIFTDVLYDSGWIAGNQAEFHVPFRMNDGWNYSFVLTTRNNEGLESNAITRTILCDVQTPETPTATLTLLPDEGRIRLTITNPDPPAENTNTGFETDTTGWTPTAGTITRDTTQQHSGAASGRINPAGAGVTAFIESTRALTTPGETWTVWGWIRATTANKPLLVTLRWYTAADVFISATSVQIATGDIVVGAWAELVLQAAAPATTGKVAMAAGVTGTPAVGDIVHVDDLKLLRGARPKVQTNTIERRRELSIFDTSTLVVVAENVAPNSVYDDWTVRSGYPYEYRVLALGDNGTTGYSNWVA